MWVVATIAAVTCLFLGTAYALDRRMRRRIEAFIESRGGITRKIKPAPQHWGEFAVVFESEAGDLRRAVVRVRKGLVDVAHDEPYHHSLPRPPQWESQAGPPEGRVLLAALRWQAELRRLPGYDEYGRIVMQLVAGPRELSIREDANGFSGILQCVQMQSKSSRDAFFELIR